MNTNFLFNLSAIFPTIFHLDLPILCSHPQNKLPLVPPTIIIQHRPHNQTMCDNLFSVINACGASSKQSIQKFLLQLLSSQTGTTGGECKRLEAVFLRLTRNFSLGRIREVSRNQRSRKELTNYQFNYGEITFRTIHAILTKIAQHHPLGTEEVFYDLGSGSGKVLFAASLCHSFRKCIGIEYLQSLYSISMELREKIGEQAAGIEEEVNDILSQAYSLPSIQIHNADFQQFDWSNGTVIFVSSTCYTRDVMSKISVLCDKLKAGTVLITLTRPLQEKNGWRVLEKFEGETSWGACTVYIHLRER